MLAYVVICPRIPNFLQQHAVMIMKLCFPEFEVSLERKVSLLNGRMLY